MTASRSLLSPFQFGPFLLPNRVVMGPMTRSRCAEDGVPVEIMTTYYGQRASAGLIVSEGVQVSQQGKGFPGTPGLHSAEQAAAWRTITDAVHVQGARIFAQLWHVGRVSHSSLQPYGRLPVAPSAIPAGGQLYTSAGMIDYETPHALTAPEIADVVAQFAAAARFAKEAGFDGVELQGSNGYLIDQFLRDGSNQRTDGYGGSSENRARLLVEILQAVKVRFPAGQIGVRISPVYPLNGMSDSDPQALFEAVAAILAKEQIAYLHGVRTGGTFDWKALRRTFGSPVILAGGFDGDSAQAAIDAGEADLIAFSTHYIANPDLVRRLTAGVPLASPEKKYFYYGGPRGYIDYAGAEDA